MAGSGKKRSKNRIAYNQLGMIAITMIVCIALAVLMFQCKNLEVTLTAYNAKAAQLEEEIEAEKERTQEIEELREYMQTDEYAEQAAREHLGLVKENEIIFEEN